jgi:hypothetical protein
MLSIAGVEAVLSYLCATSQMVSASVLYYWVTSPTYSACEWSTEWRYIVESNCSVLSARLARYDDTVHPHVLQTHR